MEFSIEPELALLDANDYCIAVSAMEEIEAMEEESGR